jgi:hypothetical protein
MTQKRKMRTAKFTKFREMPEVASLAYSTIWENLGEVMKSLKDLSCHTIR